MLSLLFGIQRLRAGRKFYIDATGGSDLNDGRSPATAWQTISKVNAFSSFLPGDRILFKRGETYNNTRLRPVSSGKAGRPITFDAYGSGALPIISLNAGSTTECLYLDKNYITVRNIAFVGGVPSIEINGANNITIEDLTITGDATVRGNGISIYGTDPHTLAFRRLTIAGCKCPVGGGAGIAANPASNVTIEDCVIHDCGTSPTSDHGIYLKNTTDCFVRRNLCYSNTSDGIVLSFVSNSVYEQNACYLNGNYGIGCHDTITNVTVRNNLIYSNVSVGLMLDVVAVTEYIYNNTIVNNGTDTTHDNMQIVIGVSGAIIKNNICVYDRAVVVGNRWPINVGNAAVVANNEFDNNCYIILNGVGNTSQAVNGSSVTLANWRLQTGTPDLNGMNADPVFTTNYTDLHLQVTSPCIGAGDSTV